jgi:chromosome segregation ATPase
MKRMATVGVLILTAVLCPRAAGQDDPRRRAEEDQRRADEAQRLAQDAELRAKEVARLQDGQRALQAKKDEIKKAMSELAVLREKSAELEQKIRKMMDEVAQEERRLQDREADAARAIERLRVGGLLKGAQGVEGKLDAILKKLESMEKRLSDLERKRQPDNQKP